MGEQYYRRPKEEEQERRRKRELVSATSRLGYLLHSFLRSALLRSPPRIPGHSSNLSRVLSKSSEQCDKILVE